MTINVSSCRFGRARTHTPLYWPNVEGIFCIFSTTVSNWTNWTSCVCTLECIQCIGSQKLLGYLAQREGLLLDTPVPVTRHINHFLYRCLDVALLCRCTGRVDQICICHGNRQHESKGEGQELCRSLFDHHHSNLRARCAIQGGRFRLLYEPLEQRMILIPNDPRIEGPRICYSFHAPCCDKILSLCEHKLRSVQRQRGVGSNCCNILLFAGISPERVTVKSEGRFCLCRVV